MPFHYQGTTYLPPLGSHVDLGHPLATGLRMAFLANSPSPYDVVSGLLLSTKGGNPRVGPGVSGLMLQLPQTGDGYSTPCPVRFRHATLYSICVRFAVTAPGYNPIPFAGVSSNANGTGGACLMELHNVTQTNIRMRTNKAGTLSLTEDAIVVPPKVPLVAVGTVNGTLGQTILYCRGNITDSGVGAAFTISYTAPYVFFGLITGGTSSANLQVQSLYLWPGTVLTPDQAMWLCEEPYAFWLPGRPKMKISLPLALANLAGPLVNGPVLKSLVGGALA